MQDNVLFYGFYYGGHILKTNFEYMLNSLSTSETAQVEKVEITKVLDNIHIYIYIYIIHNTYIIHIHIYTLFIYIYIQIMYIYIILSVDPAIVDQKFFDILTSPNWRKGKLVLNY